MANPTTSPAASPQGPEPNSRSAPVAGSQPSSRWRERVGPILSIVIILGAIVLSFWVWHFIERHPRTDDAVARANVIGVTPRAKGQIIKLNVVDNQAVAEGDLLFQIDPADYELSLEKAKSALATLDEQIEIARAQDAQLKFEIKSAEAGVERAKAELKQYGDTLKRLEPLLPKGFAKEDDVEKARTSKQTAAATLAAEEQKLNQARVALSTLASLIAQRPGAVAAVDLASLNLSYCRVTAPFQARVINLNISAGEYASIGVPVFSLLDTRKWYVIANFREGEIRHFGTGSSMDIFLSSAPTRHFQGKVQGIGWAVQPTDETDIPHGLPAIRRELNWVHIAQRFPVRIEIENPDPDLFRMGASAVAVAK